MENKPVLDEYGSTAALQNAAKSQNEKDLVEYLEELENRVASIVTKDEDGGPQIDSDEPQEDQIKDVTEMFVSQGSTAAINLDDAFTVPRNLTTKSTSTQDASLNEQIMDLLSVQGSTLVQKALAANQGYEPSGPGKSSQERSGGRNNGKQNRFRRGNGSGNFGNNQRNDDDEDFKKNRRWSKKRKNKNRNGRQAGDDANQGVCQKCGCLDDCRVGSRDGFVTSASGCEFSFPSIVSILIRDYRISVSVFSSSLAMEIPLYSLILVSLQWLRLCVSCPSFAGLKLAALRGLSATDSASYDSFLPFVACSNLAALWLSSVLRLGFI